MNNIHQSYQNMGKAFVQEIQKTLKGSAKSPKLKFWNFWEKDDYDDLPEDFPFIVYDSACLVAYDPETNAAFIVDALRQEIEVCSSEIKDGRKIYMVNDWRDAAQTFFTVL